jgi:D-amino-acid dehydrogenase
LAEAYDVIVVGGGIVGAATAYHLVCGGAKTLLIDREDVGRATEAGAGVLAPEMNRRDPQVWFDLAVKAVDYYPQLVEALTAEGAGDTSYARCGMLLVAATHDEMRAFKEAQSAILARRARLGSPAASDLYAVSSREARALFPALGEVYGALYSRVAARVDGQQMGEALRRAAEARGLRVLMGNVTALVTAGNRVTGVTVDGATLGAATVVIAGGAWSPALGEPLGLRIPVAPQRGQIVHLQLTGVATENWPIVGAFRGHYLVAWADGRVAAGATRETGSGYAVETTASGVRETLDEALRVAPGLAAARVVEIRVGVRPLTPDGLPVLGAAPGWEGLLLATGHGPTGLQLGPYSGKLMADLALGREVSDDLRPFSLARFGAS